MSNALLPPRHFWPARRAAIALPIAARLPCGVQGPRATLFTDDPHAVTCRSCVRSRLLQELLRAGAGDAVHFTPAELVRRGLLRRA
jgi:hypothetical protein